MTDRQSHRSLTQYTGICTGFVPLLLPYSLACKGIKKQKKINSKNAEVRVPRIVFLYKIFMRRPMLRYLISQNYYS